MESSVLVTQTGIWPLDTWIFGVFFFMWYLAKHRYRYFAFSLSSSHNLKRMVNPSGNHYVLMANSLTLFHLSLSVSPVLSGFFPCPCFCSICFHLCVSVFRTCVPEIFLHFCVMIHLPCTLSLPLLLWISPTHPFYFSVLTFRSWAWRRSLNIQRWPGVSTGVPDAGEQRSALLKCWLGAHVRASPHSHCCPEPGGPDQPPQSWHGT